MIVADGGVVVRVREHPHRRALEDGDLRGPFRQRRGELKRARAGADDGDALALPGEVRRPLAGVGDRAAEPIEARDVRDTAAD